MHDTVIFFDLGWTLEDETAAQKERAAAVCRMMPHLVPDDILRAIDSAGEQAAHSVFESALQSLGIPREQIPFVQKTAGWNTDLLEPCPDADTVLAALSGVARLGIIANQSRPVDSRLEKYGWSRYFDPVICSCTEGMDKPDERLFLRAIERLETQPKNIWMIGDRIDNDIVPAKRLGWKTVRIRFGSHRNYRPQREEEIPDHEIDGLTHLTSIFSL